MTEYDNAMRRQAYSLPELLRSQYADLEPKARKALTTPEIFSVQRIILTGCGDSYAAAIAAKYAFETLTGLPVETVPAIELARFYPERQLGFAPDNPLVIAVSNSGGIARVGEAVQRAVKHGGFALAVTGNPESLLGRSAVRVMELNIPPFESAPGTRGYLVSVLALLLLAIRIGEVRGRNTMDEASAYRSGVSELADRLEEGLPGMEKTAAETAALWKEFDAFDFIGAGPDYAAALYGQAKIFEAAGRYAMHINTEEWLHLNFFMKNVERIGTVCICAADSPALSRMKELLRYAVGMGRPLLVITDGGEEDFVPGPVYEKVPSCRYSFLNPLVQFVPLSLLAGFLGEMLGETDGRGCEGPWAFAEGGAGIRNSEIRVL